MARSAATGTTSKRLSAGQRHLLDLLESYCDASRESKGQPIAYPSQQTLADRMRCSVRTVQRLLTELRELGLVDVARGFVKDGRRNNYEVGRVGKKYATTVVAHREEMHDNSCRPNARQQLSPISGLYP